MQKTNITLTGFMGTGKSTIGKLLATQLNYEFVDTDKLIEQRQQRQVSDIFEVDGEAAFRQMETEVAQELAQQQNLVIATGAGMLLNPTNRDALNKCGLIFCLTAEPEDIIQRLSTQHARAQRPLLNDVDLEPRILKLLAERAAAYNQFQQINTSLNTPKQIALNIAEQAKKYFSHQ